MEEKRGGVRGENSGRLSPARDHDPRQNPRPLTPTLAMCKVHFKVSIPLRVCASLLRVNPVESGGHQRMWDRMRPHVVSWSCREKRRRTRRNCPTSFGNGERLSKKHWMLHTT